MRLLLFFWRVFLFVWPLIRIRYLAFSHRAICQVFEQVRAGQENLQAVAQGCLSLLRELIRRSTTKVGLGAIGTNGGAVIPLDISARRHFFVGLRGACPLLLETDSSALVQVNILDDWGVGGGVLLSPCRLMRQCV